MGNDEITSKNDLRPIVVDTLVVNPRQQHEVIAGTFADMTRLSDETAIKGIALALWNEEEIALVGSDLRPIVRFRPEFNPSVAMFFMRENKRQERSLFGDNDGVRVWEGDYEPVRFTKSSLIKFLKKYAKGAEATAIVESVKSLKVHESTSRTESMISLDDENYNAMEEQRLETNIPRDFHLEVPLIDTPREQVSVVLQFEASLAKKEDLSYEERKDVRKFIQLRCVNAREVLSHLMEEYMKKVPERIPRFYGKIRAQTHGEVR